MTERHRDYDDHSVDPEGRYDAEVSPHHQAIVSRFAPKRIDPERAKLIADQQLANVGTEDFTQWKVRGSSWLSISAQTMTGGDRKPQ